MDAGATVNIGWVLTGEQRDAGHPTTFSPFPITTMPPAEMVNLLASSSVSPPTTSAGLDDHVLVDNGPPDDGILTDPHVVHYDRAFHQRALFNKYARRYNGPPDRPPRNYRPSRNDGIEGQPVTPGFLEDKLGRR